MVDIGANIGTTILPLAVKFPSVKFYCVEPHPIPAARFITNCERNKVKNVNFFSTAIGLKERGNTAEIYTCPTNSGGHRLTGFHGRKDIENVQTFGPIYVQITPLHEIFKEFNIQRCDLIKIDTEGFEIYVLESLKTFLNPQNIKNAIIEMGPEGLQKAGKSGWDLISLMLNKGYTCQILGTDRYIECREEIPHLPNFSVIDLLFSS